MKTFIVHRLGWKDGGTQHWFSHPFPEEKAKLLKEKWEDINYTPTGDECDFPKDVKLDSLEYVKLEKYKKPINYKDGKMRKVTVKGISYFYKVKDNIGWVYDSNKKGLIKFTGDPHDYTPSGVRKIISEEV